MSDARESGGVLNEALRAISAEDATAGAPPAVEARVMREFRAAAAARRRRVRAAVAILTLAAMLAIAAAIPTWRSMTSHGEASREPSVPPTSRREVTTEFMPLAYSGVPMTEGHVVRMEVPRASLVSFGLVPADGIDSAASAKVLADVIVGDDGLARAVRFVRRVEREGQRQ